MKVSANFNPVGGYESSCFANLNSKNMQMNILIGFLEVQTITYSKLMLIRPAICDAQATILRMIQ